MYIDKYNTIVLADDMSILWCCSWWNHVWYASIRWPRPSNGWGYGGPGKHGMLMFGLVANSWKLVMISTFVLHIFIWPVQMGWALLCSLAGRYAASMFARCDMASEHDGDVCRNPIPQNLIIALLSDGYPTVYFTEGYHTEICKCSASAHGRKKHIYETFIYACIRRHGRCICIVFCVPVCFAYLNVLCVQRRLFVHVCLLPWIRSMHVLIFID